MPVNPPPAPTALSVNIEKALPEDLEKVPHILEEPVRTESTTSDTSVDIEAERKLLRKIDYHVVPPLAVLFLLAFLDRINIGNANIQGLSTELHLEKHQYNIALFVFFIS